MKQLLFILSFVLLGFQGCTAKNQENGTSGSGEVSQTTTSENGSSLITKEQFLKEVWNYNDSPNDWKFLGEKPVIIDFYADWCGPCRTASPILEEIANEYAGKIKVYKIDTQKERELASVFGIQSIPAFLYIPVEGKPVMTAGIGRTKDETKNMFVENIQKYLLPNK